MEVSEWDDSMNNQKLIGEEWKHLFGTISENPIFAGVVLVGRETGQKHYIFQCKYNTEGVFFSPEDGSVYEIAVVDGSTKFILMEKETFFNYNDIRYPTKWEFFQYNKLKTV